MINPFIKDVPFFGAMDQVLKLAHRWGISRVANWEFGY